MIVTKLAVSGSKEDCLLLSVCGDTVQTEGDKSLFESGDLSALMGEDLSALLLQSDVRVFNLEAPLTDKSEKLFKPGAPHLASSAKSANFFKKLSPCVLSCANNHIKDFGVSGIVDTEEIAKANGFCLTGVSSKNKNDAKRACKIEKNGLSCTIYSIAENEFSIASDACGGANGYDALCTFDEVRALAADTDYLIVLFHAGRENFPFPSPLLQRQCRKLIECGASVVICQHSHCIGCAEDYMGGKIVYGQGNFIFNRSALKTWLSGLVVQLNMTRAGLAVSFVAINRQGNGIVKSDEALSAQLLGEMEARSQNLKEEGFLDKEWARFCNTQKTEFFLGTLCGIKSKYVKAVDRRTNHFFTNLLYKNSEKRNLILNFIRCESIRESLMTMLEDKSWEKH